MNNKNKTLFATFSLIALTSCGQDLVGAMAPITYHTDDFETNMYVDQVLDNSLSADHIVSTSTHNISSENLIVGVENLRNEDKYYTNALGQQVVTTDDRYAQGNHLSLTVPSVIQGFESKLFDGILHCIDAIRVSKSRLQLRESGFGYQFTDQLATYQHVGVYLKGGADTANGGVHISDLRVHLSFYVDAETSGNYLKHEFVFDVLGLRSSDYPQFYGFYFDQSGMASTALVNASAVSLTYEILDAPADASPDGTTGVFCYEILLPKSTWQ